MNHIEIKRRQIQLAAAALGLIVVWILGKTIGYSGVAYLAAALEGFAFIWVIIGANISDTLGRLLRGRKAKGQYKNAAKLQSSIFVFQGIAGVIGSVLFFVLSLLWAETVFRVPYSRFLMVLLSPVIFLRTINEVFLGVFQGDGSELPSAVTSILRQVLILGLGLLFGRLLTDYGEKISNLLGPAAFTAMYGGIGVVIAILLTELLIFLFLFLIYKESKRKEKNKDNNGMRSIDSFGGQVATLYGNRGASIFFGFLLLLPLWLGLIFLQRSAPDIYGTADAYGLYVGKYLGACGILIALLAAAVLPTAVKVVAMLRKDELRQARNTFQSGMKSGVAVSLFYAVFLAVMAEQLAATVSNTMQGVLTEMYMFGSGILVFAVIAYYCYVLLKLSGNQYWMLGCFAVADMVFAGTLSAFLGNSKGDIQALVYAGLVSAGVLAVSLCFITGRLLRMGIDWVRTFAIPIGCVCVTGLLCHLLAGIFTPHLGNLVTLIVIFVLLLLIYWVLLLVLHCFGEQELKAVCGGRILRGLGKLLGVF